MNDTRILPVTEDVQWIGVLDESIVTFDIVMTTEYGTTYNSYFINAGKKTIIDTSKETFRDVYLEKVRRSAVLRRSNISFAIIQNPIIPAMLNTYSSLHLMPLLSAAGRH